jgi:hypothetical protein
METGAKRLWHLRPKPPGTSSLAGTHVTSGAKRTMSLAPITSQLRATCGYNTAYLPVCTNDGPLRRIYSL